jgi:hypothetical protein
MASCARLHEFQMITVFIASQSCCDQRFPNKVFSCRKESQAGGVMDKAEPQVSFCSWLVNPSDCTHDSTGQRRVLELTSIPACRRK